MAISVIPRRWDKAKVARGIKMGLVGASVMLLSALAVVPLGLDVDYMLKWTPHLLSFIPVVLMITVVSLALAIFVGIVVAAGRMSKHVMLSEPARAYMSLVRGTPLVVQLFLIYLALPQLARGGPDWLERAATLEPIQAAILALSLFHGAYLAEVFRGGVMSVSDGQREAGRAIGMSGVQVQRRVVFPQAVRYVIPPLGSHVIMLILDSSLLGFLGVAELFSRAQRIGRQGFKLFEMLIVATVIYWCLVFVFSGVQQWIERRLERAYLPSGATSSPSRRRSRSSVAHDG